MLKRYKIRDYNFRLVLWLFVLSALGVLLVGSADSSLQNRQLFGVLMGAAFMIVFSLIDFSWILSFYWIIYGINIVLLLVVLGIGWASHGAQRWIDLGFTTFQPVEISKIFLVLFFAKYLMVHENEVSKPKIILRSLVLIGFPLALIYKEPDLKNTITIAIVFLLIYYVAGLSYKILLPFLAVIIAGAVIFVSIIVQPNQNIIHINDYQRERIMAFLYPDSTEYTDANSQQKNSVTAIGSGELTGKGLNNSDVSSANKGNFIPEIQTDFIFAVAGEELGFFGSAGIVILLLLIVLECLLMSRRAKDLSGRIICCGIASVVSIQSFINIAVAIGLFPNTGTPLPFVSYGLSSLVSLYIGMGLVLNVGLQNRIRLTGEALRSAGGGMRVERG
jgi:rod shape determining protein RodA